MPVTATTVIHALHFFFLLFFHVDVTQGCDKDYHCTGPSQTYPSFSLSCNGVNEQGCWTKATAVVRKQSGLKYVPHFTPFKWRPLMGDIRHGKGVQYNMTLEKEGWY